VRRTEVRAFMTYSLVLAVICALGVIWEYRFKQNLFSTWTEHLLPPGFRYDTDVVPGAGAVAGDLVDSAGRRGVVGPAEVGLEAVSMLAIALPIALVGLLSAKRRRDRMLYGLAVCVLVAASFATVRKSAMLAPISVILTLAYFRRRELLSLAPLGLVVVIAVAALSPGAVHETIAQFATPNRANVPTTQDRVSDYDAVRPDVWTHLLFGRGYGSYNHDTYRILDSEILGRTVETGVLGLAAFLLIGVSVVFAARSTIASRAGPYAGLALIGTAAAVCFLVVSALYDVLSFAHITYVFLYMAGLVAVVVERRPAPPPPTPPLDPTAQLRSPARKSPTLMRVG
jgi:O-antigen ligase